MTRKKTIISLLLLVAMCVAATFLTACFGDGGSDVSLDHTCSYGDWTYTLEPTCTEAGERSHTCRYCDKTETETVPALGHEYGEWEEITAPTCDAAGETTRICERDNTHKITQTVAALGHDYSDWAVTKPATCGVAGVESRICHTDQSHVETRPITALEHVYLDYLSFDTENHWQVCSICSVAETSTHGHTLVDTACSGCSYVVSTATLTYTLIDDDTAYSVSGSSLLSTDKMISIPSTHEGLPVTTIADNAFASKNITSVIIPDSITTIGEYAFSSCSSLKNLTIPDSVTTIGSHAFEDCASLKSLYLPSGLTSIGANAFQDCDGLAGQISIPNGVTEISEYAFDDCDNITNIIIPSTVTTIGFAAFESCDSLTSVYIPNSVTKIDAWAFDGCNSLTSVVISGNNSTIGESAFAGCDALKSLVLLEGVKTIGTYAFLDCEKLAEVVIPNGVTTIGKGAFGYCAKLRSIVIPNSVTSIGDYAFLYTYIAKATMPLSAVASVPSTYLQIVILTDGTEIELNTFKQHYNLTIIELPKTLTSISGRAFSDCHKLKEVYNRSNLYFFEGYYIDGNHISHYVFSKETNVYDPISSTSKITIDNGYMFYNDNDNYYLMGYIGSDKELVLPSSINGSNEYSIYKYAFYGNDHITELEISDAVTTIGEWAFSSCSELTNITIGEGAKKIIWSAFAGCDLANIVVDSGNTVYKSADNYIVEIETGTLVLGRKDCVIPTDGTIQAIGDYAFYNCSGLTGELIIPDSVTLIGESAFYYCSGLTSLTLGNGVTWIWDMAFYNCTGLTGELVIPDSVTWIGESAFYYCSGLTSLTLGNGVTWIGKKAFSYCTGLIGELVIPASVTEIGDSAFANCSKLTSLTLGNGVTTIGEWAFYNCSGLTGNLVIPDSVTFIDRFAFADCSGVTSITFENTEGWFNDNTDFLVFVGTPIDVSDPAANATYFLRTYMAYRWRRDTEEEDFN